MMGNRSKRAYNVFKSLFQGYSRLNMKKSQYFIKRAVFKGNVSRIAPFLVKVP